MRSDLSTGPSRSQFHMHTKCCCRRRRRCCCSVCCYTAVVAAAAVLLLPVALLLPATVRHRVSNGQICCWFIEFYPSIIRLNSNAIYFCWYPFAARVAVTASICLVYILRNYGHARSQGGRQHAAAKLPLYTPGIYLVHIYPPTQHTQCPP